MGGRIGSKRYTETEKSWMLESANMKKYRLKGSESKLNIAKLHRGFRKTFNRAPAYDGFSVSLNTWRRKSVMPQPHKRKAVVPMKSMTLNDMESKLKSMLAGIQSAREFFKM